MRSVLTLVALLLAPAALARTPEEVAREVLEAQARGDAVAAGKSTLERCQDQPVAHTLPIEVLGAPATLDSLTVTPLSTEGDRATVSYTATGHVDARDHKTTINLFGVEAQVEVDQMQVEEISLQGTLELVKSGGAWKLSCPE